MRRATSIAVLCSLIVFAALVATARPSDAARARFRFGTHGSATRPAPVARNTPGLRASVWSGCGEVLTPSTTNAVTFQHVFSTGSGGSLVAWSDERSGKLACRATRLDLDGDYVAGWIAGGNLVAASDSSQLMVSAGTDDAGGGFFVYVNVDPQYANAHDIYLQHLTASGGAAGGYLAGGKLMAPGSIGVGGMLPDGSGGLFFGWSQPDGTNIRVTRLDASGVATAGWPAGGIDTGVNDAANGEPATDGAGGIYFVWSTATEVRIQRFASTGVVGGWPAGGLTVATPNAGTNPTIATLSSNDALVSWVDPTTSHVFAMRVNAAGSLNVSWPAGGKQISTATGPQDEPWLLQDGAGGGLIMWLEHTVPAFFGQMYVQRLTSAGAVATGWPAEGVPLSSSAAQFGASNLVSDGANGAIAAWTDLRNGNDADIYAQRVLATGVVDANWTADGAAICAAAGDQVFPVITTDGSGGAIVTLQDYTDNFNPDNFNPQVRAARVLVDGTVSALASLVNAVVEPGRVQLHWFTPDGSVRFATVERADAGAEFVAVGNVSADGEGHLRFEDRDVTAGATYLYRLAVQDGATTEYLGQVTIHVPAAVSFGITGFRPNPAEAQVSVVFALESGAPARLELLDVAGRRVMTREVGMLGPGQHVLPLQQTAALPAGIYVLRLTQSGREAVTRAALMR